MEHNCPHMKDTLLNTNYTSHNPISLICILIDASKRLSADLEVKRTINRNKDIICEGNFNKGIDRRLCHMVPE